MISIIIATLNEKDYIPRLLKDLGKQQFKQFEIIVVDGNSSDNTLEIAKSFGCKTLITKTKHQTHQQNLGAKYAKYDILLFLDADIQISSPNFLKTAIDYFTNNELSVATFYTEYKEKMFRYLASAFLMNLFVYLGKYILPTAHGGFGIMSNKLDHQKVKGLFRSRYISE